MCFIFVLCSIIVYSTSRIPLLATIQLKLIVNMSQKVNNSDFEVAGASKSLGVSPTKVAAREENVEVSQGRTRNSLQSNLIFCYHRKKRRRLRSKDACRMKNQAKK